jgi:hypothetical protein
MATYVLERYEDPETDIFGSESNEIEAVFTRRKLPLPTPLIASDDSKRFAVVQKEAISALDIMVMNTELSYLGYQLKGPFKPGEAAQYWKLG